MKTGKWTSRQKPRIVLAGIRGREVGRICAENAINRTQRYRLRHQFLRRGHEAFEADRPTGLEARHLRE